MADEQAQADMSQTRGKVAAGMPPGQAKKDFIARQGEGKTPLEELGAEAYRQQNVNAAGGTSSVFPAAAGSHPGAQIHHDGQIYNGRQGS